jgi:hypothetical protein
MIKIYGLFFCESLACLRDALAGYRRLGNWHDEA